VEISTPDKFTKMLSLYAATQSFNAPVLHVAQQPAVRSSPVQMMEMSSRRAALLSAATLAIPGVANAATAVWQVNPEGWGSKKYGGAQADATSTPAQALDPLA
jgi:hypothetical protein